MDQSFLKNLEDKTRELKELGFYKDERVITTPQSAVIKTAGRAVVNLCANNYLGLANHTDLKKAAEETLNRRGFGLASVRFICGTQDIHKQLEARLSNFLQTEDTILFSSCFDANAGLFETLLDEKDAILSDTLNHASIIDGIRLCKAKRFRYKNNNLEDLEAKLQEAKDSRYKLIATDGVFSMDGVVCQLAQITKLAEQYGAMVMVDDSHAVGFVGPQGRGTHELCQVIDKVDIITGTLGKALGGASGGYVSGKKQIIEWLRQRSRPYLFSNSLAPLMCGAGLAALDLIESDAGIRKRLWENTSYFRKGLEELGFGLLGANHPIIPVLIKDARKANIFAEKLMEQGIYVVSFSFPVVPKNGARIRTQISESHSKEDLEHAIKAFRDVGKELGIIS